MIFSPTDLEDVYLVHTDPVEDERGYFARTFCEREFSERGLCTRVAQCSVSFNRRRGTVRGLHYQQPHPEAKLIRCLRGAIFDVVLHVPSRRWVAMELRAGDGKCLYVGEGLAHGFQTLEDDTEVHYQISEHYHPEAAHGVRFDDPSLAIPWPLEVTVISSRDRGFPDLD